MANPSHHPYGSSGKSPRSSPTGDSGGSLFQTGQGGRTVLPPLSDAFPTSQFPGRFSNALTSQCRSDMFCYPAPGSYAGQYHPPRSPSGRHDYSTTGTYPNQWSQGHGSQYSTAFPLNFPVTHPLTLSSKNYSIISLLRPPTRLKIRRSAKLPAT